MTRPEPVRFVVLALARTGSSLVARSLGAHPDVYMHGEIFHPNVAHHIREPLRAFVDLSLRARDPVAFVESVFAYAPGGERWRGFKHFANESRPACDWLLAERGVRKIILERENRLALWSSRRLAQETQVWNLAADVDPARVAALRETRVRFRPKIFREFVRETDATYAYYRATARGRILTVSYDRLTAGDLDEIRDFLGLPPRALPPLRAKLHGTDILARFEAEDHDAIRATLARMGREDWLEERA